MSIAEYFENAKGRGILSTANSDGEVDAAVYGKPKIIDENTIAFIMRDRRTHANVQSNPHAAYLFMEHEGGGYKGIRLYLTKVHEEQDTERLYALRRPDHNAIAETREERGPLFLVLFNIDAVRPITPRGGNPLEQGDAATHEGNAVAAFRGRGSGSSTERLIVERRAEKEDEDQKDKRF